MNQRTKTDTESLRSLLARCRELVAGSEDFVWSGMDAADIRQSLDAGMVSITGNSKPDVGELTLLFAPTGPLQETSISNDWSEEFLAIASEFDALIAKW